MFVQLRHKSKKNKISIPKNCHKLDGENHWQHIKLSIHPRSKRAKRLAGQNADQGYKLSQFEKPRATQLRKMQNRATQKSKIQTWIKTPFSDLERNEEHRNGINKWKLQEEEEE